MQSQQKLAKDFRTFGNSHSDIHIIDEPRPDDAAREMQALYEGRIKDLETKIEEYRVREQDRLSELLENNVHKAAILKDQFVDISDISFSKAALDTISIL